jgi:hypothetical protein
MVYVPFAADIVELTGKFDCNALTDAPLSSAPLAAFVTVPVIDAAAGPTVN